MGVAVRVILFPLLIFDSSGVTVPITTFEDVAVTVQGGVATVNTKSIYPPSLIPVSQADVAPVIARITTKSPICDSLDIVIGYVTVVSSTVNPAFTMFVNTVVVLPPDTHEPSNGP